MSQTPAGSIISARATARRQPGRAFAGLIDAVLVQSPVAFSFDGAISTDDANAAWLWMARDLAPDLIDLEAIDDGPASVAAVESLMPELMTRARNALAGANADRDANRRLRSQLGGDEAWDRLPIVLTALRCRALLNKAAGFGRAANGMADDAALALALQSMPLNDPPVAALLLHVAVGQVATPTRLITAAIRICGGATESALIRAGLAPVVDAILAHAQSQLPLLTPRGAFADMDLVCRAVDRFHRLMRAISGYVELSRTGRWAAISSALTTAVSERLDPKLRDVAPDLNKALRRREGTDRLDRDQILSALNGMYLLAAVRDSRDSLAVNALFDQVWAQTGQALEIHIERNLGQLRDNPADGIASARLDAALKMAEVRFNQEYADTLRRAKEIAERRVS